MQPQSPPLPVRYPLIPQAAKLLGTSRQNLWRALMGHIASPALVRGYTQLVMPRLMESLALAELPPGTKLTLPSLAGAKILAFTIGESAERKGRALRLLSPVPLSRPAPADALSTPAAEASPTDQ